MKLVRLLIIGLLPIACFAWPHTVCKQGKTTVIEGDSNWKQGLEKGWWTDGACPEPPPEPPPKPKLPPEPPKPPAPPPTPAPLYDAPVRPGPAICKAFADVRGADVLVITNMVARPNVCNVWKFNSDGTLFETSSFDLDIRQKKLINADLGFFGWWEVRCSDPWKGSRQQPNLDIAGTMGAFEREATACME